MVHDGLGRSRRRKREPSFRGDNICCLPLLTLILANCFLFFFFSSCSCLFPGELFRQWGSHLGQIETSISHSKQENQKSIRVELFSPALSGVHTPPAPLHMHGNGHNLRSHLIKHVMFTRPVLRSSVSPVSRHLPSSYRSSLFTANIWPTEEKIYSLCLQVVQS